MKNLYRFFSSFTWIINRCARIFWENWSHFINISLKFINFVSKIINISNKKLIMSKNYFRRGQKTTFSKGREGWFLRANLHFWKVTFSTWICDFGTKFELHNIQIKKGWLLFFVKLFYMFAFFGIYLFLNFFGNFKLYRRVSSKHTLPRKFRNGLSWSRLRGWVFLKKKISSFFSEMHRFPQFFFLRRLCFSQFFSSKT